MNITIRYFARYREIAGRNTEPFALEDGATVAQAGQALIARYPDLAELLPRSIYAVNRQYVPADTPLREGDELVFIPPMGGGAASMIPLIKITREPLDRDAIIAAVAHPEAGGIVTFEGVVRNHARGKQIRYLEYDAYPEMAEEQFARIAAEAQERWGPARIAIWHRIGRLEIGEASVIVVVATPHRAQAFEACRYAIDTLKTTVPIWKKEVAEDGEEWVEG
ncbi:MAG TPA: molybdenum cofactor biosynthesis protein MoaE [Ktedonobacterales bacterium]|jgi:molybdopterin synthase catalytic subunit